MPGLPELQTSELKHRVPLDLFVPRCFSEQEINHAILFVGMEITTPGQATDEGIAALDFIIKAVYLQFHMWDNHPDKDAGSDDVQAQIPLHFFVSDDFTREQIELAYSKLCEFAHKISLSAEDAYPGESIGIMGALHLLYRIYNAYHYEIDGQLLTLPFFGEEPDWEDFSHQVSQDAARTYMAYYLNGPRRRASQPVDAMHLARAAATHFFLLKNNQPPNSFAFLAKQVLEQYNKGKEIDD